MPVYDYLCEACGPFTEVHPMAECDAAQDCPGCGAPAQRALLNAPLLASMSASKRTALAVNERSAHAPRTLGDYKATHRPGCSCCRTKPGRLVAKAAGGAKSFPTARPWMISH